MCDPIFQIGLELIRPMPAVDFNLTERRIFERRSTSDVLAQAHKDWQESRFADRRKNTGRRIDDRSEQ